MRASLDRRPYYFDGERLGVADFLAERDHLDGLRGQANATLHGAGIARGLQVSVGSGAKSVAISAGMAIQPSGREVHLTDDACVATPGLGDQSIDLFIVSRPRPSDVADGSPRLGFEHLVQVAMPFFAGQGATIDDEAVYLATVALGADGKITSIDSAARRSCGYHVAALGLRAPGDGTVRAKLSLVDDAVEGLLSIRAEDVAITGALEIADSLGIGTMPSRAKLDVRGEGPTLMSLIGDDGRAILAIGRDTGSVIGEGSGKGQLTVDGDIALDAEHFILFDGAGAMECGSSLHSISLTPETDTTPARMAFSEAGRIDLYSGATGPRAAPT